MRSGWPDHGRPKPADAGDAEPAVECHEVLKRGKRGRGARGNVRLTHPHFGRGPGSGNSEKTPRIASSGKFTQVDSSDNRKVGGTGLGLNISKQIVERHKATIDYVSELGSGSTFFLEFDRLKGKRRRKGRPRTGREGCLSRCATCRCLARKLRAQTGSAPRRGVGAPTLGEVRARFAAFEGVGSGHAPTPTSALHRLKPC